MPHKPDSHWKTIKRIRGRAKVKDRFYDSVEWLQCRAEKLSLSPLCEECREAGRVRVATEVHHILERKEHPHLAFTLSNLQSLCKSCHSKHSKGFKQGHR